MDGSLIDKQQNKRFYHRRIVWLGLPIGILLGVLIGLSCWQLASQPYLVFYKENSQEIVALLPVEYEASFSIIFVHSIHLKDVFETYRIRKDNQIEQTEIIYEEFGIGMPSHAPKGATFIQKENRYHIQNLGIIMPLMKIRNGKTVSEHRLCWQDKKGKEHQVYFNQYFTPGAWFTLEVKKLPRYKTWREVIINDKK